MNAPKRILNDLLIQNGYLDCDSALTPHNMVRTEEMYYEPFRTGRTELFWETFNYTDSDFVVLKNKDDEEEKRQCAEGAMQFLKCWSYECLKSNLIVKKKVPEAKATEILDKFFNELLTKYYYENVEDRVPSKITSFCMIISKRSGK